MKTHSNSKNRGFVAMTAVISVGLMIVAGLAFAYRHHIRSLENEAQSQIKIDYAQKEEAVLRALLHIVPNKAMGAMQRYSSDDAGAHSWETIFAEAIDLANAETAVDSSMLAGLGSPAIITANTGDTSFSSTTDYLSAVSGTSGVVNPGVTQESTLLLDSEIGPKLPSPLQCSWSTFRKDEDYPIVTLSKTHSPSWTKGLHLSPDDYPLYNQYRYPNIRFGYSRPGDLFVAKRNWWAFTLKIGSHDEGQTGVPIIEKHYLLSLYEVPSQLPMSASGFMSVGQHADGTAWNNANLSGGVFAGRLETEGTVNLADGLFSARNSTNFSGDTSVAGRAVADNFDALGVRESREAGTGNNFHDASLAGNVGRVVFIPINRGNDFLGFDSDGSSGERLSPTGWNEYTQGGRQAEMRIRIREMSSIDAQTPIEVQFYYRRDDGQRVYRTYTRGDNWPSDSQPGGVGFPFQTAMLSLGRRALIWHADRLPAFLASLGDAADVTVNNSIYLYPDSAQSTVNEPNFPSTESDCAISLRGGEDMSAYTAGFSMVTNLRLYIGASLNTIPIPPPAASGLPPTAEFYPPVSLFAPEKRFGVDSSFTHPVEFTGQLNSLKTDENDAFRPLDLKSGSDDSVNPNLINADLKMLNNPAELPPIHLMNWLFTIEEIHAGP